jgi:hypothetical protein
MGEYDTYARYHAARRYADEQAEKYLHGEEIDGWTYESGYLSGAQKPKRVRLTGAAWVAYAYEMAAVNASVLVQAQGQWWQPVVEDCKRLAVTYRTQPQQQASRKILKNNDTVSTKHRTKHILLRWDTQKRQLIVTTRREQMQITPEEAVELGELLSQYHQELVTALYHLSDSPV